MSPFDNFFVSLAFHHLPFQPARVILPHKRYLFIAWTGKTYFSFIWTSITGFSQFLFQLILLKYLYINCSQHFPDDVLEQWRSYFSSPSLLTDSVIHDPSTDFHSINSLKKTQPKSLQLLENPSICDLSKYIS